MKSQEQILKIKTAVEKTRQKGIYSLLAKITELQTKLTALNHPDFVKNEVKRLIK